MDPQFPTSLELDPKFVKTGIWTNRDDGPILGRTITTDTQTGNLVVALLAILSTLGTAHLWHLIAFAIHQFRANGLPTDALFRQQQALLRTLPTPSSVIAEALKLWWAWRRKADRPFLRSILLVLIAILFAALTTTASIFSSLIVDSGTITVLAQSPNCGQVNITREVWKTYKQAVDRSAPAYTQECYRNGTLPPSCDVFTQPSIPLTVENVPCPFNETMCDTKDAVSVDSGLIDVSKSFGLNLAAKDSISFRKKIECTVLPVDGYYRVFDLKDVDAWKPDYREIFPEEQVGATFYGPKPPFLTGETYLVYLVSSNSSGNPSVPRGVKWFQNGNATRLSDWIPIEGFYPITVDGPEGDVFLKPLMSGALSFDSPIDDPLYSAHKEIESMNYFTGEPYKNYIADYPIKTVGCHHHLQYCHARDGKEDWCSPFEGVRYPLLEEYDFPEANEVQRATLELLVKSTYMYPTADVLSCKMNRLLSMSTFEMKPIPDDFWKQEVLGWEQQVWAAMQIMVSRHAIGPEEGDPYSDGGYLIKPTTEGERTLCAAQKMKKNGGFVNINVFGFSFVVAFSILVAIIDITLLRFLVYLTRFRRALGPRIARWTQDGVWQLQRRAYEGEGHRNWTDLESEIPLMEKGHKLNDLPIMWRPGKSPIIMQTSSFDSTDSMVSQQSSVSELAAEDVVESAPVVTEQRSWFSFVRR